MRSLAVVLRFTTPDFMSRYTTVIGRTVYLPHPRPEGDVLARILAHEWVHQHDQRRWGPWFVFSYLVVLPVGRTMRAHWERRAYAVDLMLVHQEHGEWGLIATAARLRSLFAGPAYAYMWAGRGAVKRYVSPVVEAVRDGTLQTQEPYRTLLEVWNGPTESSASDERSIDEH